MLVRRPGAGRLPADAADRARRRGRSASPTRASSLLGVAHRPGRPDPQRGDLARRDLGVRRLAGRSAPAGRGRRRRRAPRLRAVDAPRLAGLRQPAAGPGRGQRVERSTGSTSSPGTTRRPWRATSRSARPGCSSCASTGIAHNLVTVLLLVGLPISLIGLLALPWQARGAAIRPVLILSRRHVPGDQPALPGGDDLGHVPPRVRPGPGAASSCRRCSPSTRASPGSARGQGWTRPVAWLGPTLGIFGSLLFSIALLPIFGAGSRDTADPVRRARTPDGGHRPSARRDRGSGHHRLPDLAGRDRADPGPGPARRAADATCSTSRATRPSRAPTWSSSIGRRRTGDGRRSSTTDAPDADCFQRAGPRSRARPDGPDPLDGVRVFEVVCP